MKIKEIKNSEIKTMAMLNASKDFESFTVEDLKRLGLKEAFTFRRAEYPKVLKEYMREDFWFLVLEKQESEALKMITF